MMAERIEGKWIQMFVRALRLCGIGAGDPVLATRAYSRANLDGVGTPIEGLARAGEDHG